MGRSSSRMDPTGENPSLDRLTITSKGFQFLLEERQTQLWQILMYYLASKEVGGSPFCWMWRKADEQARNERSAEVLSLFFSLGCMQLGQVSPSPLPSLSLFPHSSSANES